MKLLVVLLLMGSLVFSQEEKAKEKALNESKNMTWEGNKNLANNNFIEAEVEYRKAISKSDENSAAPYNLGNAYYNNETYAEAFGRFKQAGESATQKADKHKAYHNMGNVFMKRKEYEKAVEAYKEALRNDSKDDETRYNLALAKEMLKKQQDEQKDDKNKDQEDKEKKDEKKDNKEGDNEDENKESKKEGDKGDEKKEENEDGKGDKKEEEQKQPEKGENEKEQKQQRPNQLSKQQIQNLLEAMQNEEKKVQQKIDAKKVKGVKVKNEKDW